MPDTRCNINFIKIEIYDESTLWTSTTDSSINKWVVPIDTETDTFKDFSDNSNFYSEIFVDLKQQPDYKITGSPGIRKYCMLNNKRHVLAQDNLNYTKLYDIINCAKIAEYGSIDFDDKLKEINGKEWVSNWCTIDIKCGV